MTPYWSGDGIELYLGDCREVTGWLGADVLVMDPPYGIAWSQKIGGYRGAGSQIDIRNAVEGDVSTGIRDGVLGLWGDRPWVTFGSWRAPKPTGTEHRLIWHKAGSAPGPAHSAFMLQDEEIYVSGRGFRKSSPPLRSVITTREARSVEVARIGHPTPKPVGLMQLLIDRCPPGIVADPFAGSGSTLVAARLQGRQAIGVELVEKYCEIAARRLDQGVLDFGDTA